MWFYKDIKIVHKVSKTLSFKKIDYVNHMKNEIVPKENNREGNLNFVLNLGWFEFLLFLEFCLCLHVYVPT
jgi:hypothetical protein